MDITLYLVLIGIAYALLTILIQRKLSNPSKSMEIQVLMNEKLKEIKKLAAEDKELYMQKQKEVSKMMMDNMKMQFKPLLITFPLFLGIFYLLLPYIFSGFLASKPEITILSIGLTYSQFFIALIFVIGFAVTMVLTRMDRRRVTKQLEEQGKVQSNNNISQTQ